jgi:hypothetical protein
MWQCLACRICGVHRSHSKEFDPQQVQHLAEVVQAIARSGPQPRNRVEVFADAPGWTRSSERRPTFLFQEKRFSARVLEEPKSGTSLPGPADSPRAT